MPVDTLALAHDARSVLACPSRVSLLVRGIPHEIEDVHLDGLQGRPVLTCEPHSPIARLADQRPLALLTLTSGLGRSRGEAREDRLTLCGRLETTSVVDCDCCGERRHLVTLVPTFALLTRAATDSTPESHHRVPLAEFAAPDLDLNQGYLQRTIEHVNDAHGEELRRTVMAATGLRPGDILDARLGGLDATGAVLEWVDTTGAHTDRLHFPRAVRSPVEMGHAMRSHLHGIC